MRVCPVPVIVLSNQTDKDPETTFQALELGAADFYLKNALLEENVKPEIIREFLDRLKAIAQKARKCGRKKSNRKLILKKCPKFLTIFEQVGRFD